MLKAMKDGIETEKSGKGLLPDYTQFIGGAEYTISAMKQAPVAVFVFNAEKSGLREEFSPQEKLFDIANIQSIGAAIENMLLTATDLYQYPTKSL